MDKCIDHIRNTHHFLLLLVLVAALAILHYPETVEKAVHYDALRKKAHVWSCLVHARNNLRQYYTWFREDQTRLETAHAKARELVRAADKVSYHTGARSVLQKLDEIWETLEGKGSPTQAKAKSAAEYFNEMVARAHFSIDSLDQDWLKLVWVAGVVFHHMNGEVANGPQFDRLLSPSSILFTCKLLGLTGDQFSDIIGDRIEIDRADIVIPGTLTFRTLDTLISDRWSALESEMVAEGIPTGASDSLQLPSLGLTASVLYVIPIYIVLSVPILCYMVVLLNSALDLRDRASGKTASERFWLPIMVHSMSERSLLAMSIKGLAAVSVWLPFVLLVGCVLMLIIKPLSAIPHLKWTEYSWLARYSWWALGAVWAAVGGLATHEIWKAAKHLK